MDADLEYLAETQAKADVYDALVDILGRMARGESPGGLGSAAAVMGQTLLEGAGKLLAQARVNARASIVMAQADIERGAS